MVARFNALSAITAFLQSLSVMRPNTETRDAMRSSIPTMVFSTCSSSDISSFYSSSNSSSNSSACFSGSSLLSLISLFMNLCTTPFRGPTASSVSLYYVDSKSLASSILVNLTVSYSLTCTYVPSAHTYPVRGQFHPSKSSFQACIVEWKSFITVKRVITAVVPPRFLGTFSKNYASTFH